MKILVIDDNMDTALPAVQASIAALQGRAGSVELWVPRGIDNATVVEGGLVGYTKRFMGWGAIRAELRGSPPDILILDLGYDEVDGEACGAASIAARDAVLLPIAKDLARQNPRAISGLVLLDDFLGILERGCDSTVLPYSHFTYAAEALAINKFRRRIQTVSPLSNAEAIRIQLDAEISRLTSKRALKWSSRLDVLVEAVRAIPDAWKTLTESGAAGHDWLDEPWQRNLLETLAASLPKARVQTPFSPCGWERLKGYVQNRFSLIGLIGSLLEIPAFGGEFDSAGLTIDVNLHYAGRTWHGEGTVEVVTALQTFGDFVTPAVAGRPLMRALNWKRDVESDVVMALVILGGGQRVKLDVAITNVSSVVITGSGPIADGQKGHPCIPLFGGVNIRKIANVAASNVFARLAKTGWMVYQRTSVPLVGDVTPKFEFEPREESSSRDCRSLWDDLSWYATDGQVAHFRAVLGLG